MSRKDREKPQNASPADQRARRLAEALRANLKRRKAAGRKSGGTEPGKPKENED
jgi:hypothetical protein